MGNCFGFRSESSYLLDQEVYETQDDQDESPRTDHQVPIYHISPGLPILASDLTEEEQIQIVKRIHMLQFLPLTNYVPVNKEKLRECIICMNDLKLGDEVRYLPCLHTYHRICIDEWLMRSFSCPTCLLNLEPDTSLTTTTTTTTVTAPRTQILFSSENTVAPTVTCDSSPTTNNTTNPVISSTEVVVSPGFNQSLANDSCPNIN
ncbi:RING finger protein 11 [Schistosoma haematobium]|uniref:RING finger protein 11 n=1 Tax=Schistosoma haematobium TaxID=6185 RepID=A0A094ZX47_SCHHA|nr:RING finger protein 11 [Schistosoma haematobium]KAH9589511.1 RING finger protein 11 [Schistosoma haematobium]CAH8646694.1 unnamed protein product [Schistosoma haematobium]